MRKIRKPFGLTAWLVVIMLLTLSCNDDLDIRSDYAFDLEIMPVQKKIVQGETVEIRCRIVREGEYSEEHYSLRFFQTDGKGELRLDEGTLFAPNDLYPLDRLTFRLYYTSRCTDQQNIDIVIVNSTGRIIQKTLSWQNENSETNQE